ncbi:UDP-N-acetylmuramoyl-L-alanyl-D-glutamate--2,6-diaminopimelate ligase [Caldalkalibacillus uzonensis]|uniref:UDP-N-acetylmuramoyl-L-alanyl-D-glutamate--2,6-diaminopimelate ligase n=1 Tax=Caldalkalibacillus uzonensis TaxID=353224 RepID=A0ABU0CS18_9BACI|nr:UDP-N-acetylmuramoyl-L-alanyl-D-glutamate--2,6-diaminopimelate ligase [Caldalkalibacillus uzonensis]MDQ0339218.1 UDP-N-acetylmuramoyl-L-alanyl-D-glutamate--2,6-diaminopimelate ligase [Caldalkalibacillus uzonensis]
MQLHKLIQDLIPYQVHIHAHHHESDQSGDGHLPCIEISSIELDSRQVTPGSLFVCIPGFRVDGHQFARQAVEQGARAILAQKPLDVPVPVIVVPDTRRALAYVANCFYGFPTQKLRLIGVTGTNGKTTVTYLIEKMLEDQGLKTGRIGTINMKIGNRVQEVKNTTPESLHLQQAFHDMLEASCSHAVIEVSSHALDMGRVRGCNFGVAIFTNLTQDHLDYHQSMEQYKQAKGLLFSQLGNGISEGDLKYAILNADDSASDYYMKITPAQVLTYGIHSEQADIKASDIALSPQGVRFTVYYGTQQEKFDVPLVGMFNVYNVLAAVGAGIVEGLSLSQIRESLSKIECIPGRMETVEAGQDFTVIVDYAHTPDSLANVLSTARQLAQKRLICVVGCGGDRDRGKRPLMAQMAVKYADLTVLTSDNPRSEDPQAIINDMEKGLIDTNVSQTKYTSIVDRREAIHWAINQAEQNDVIIIAGKGHETYQEIKGQRYHFDDREVAREVLASLKL